MKFSECWYRHLHCVRDQGFMKASQQFLNQMRDNPQALIKDFSDEARKKVGNNCSGELVARYFKALGLIKGPPA